MNKLVIGLADKTDVLRPSKPGFLLIDDGPICDAFLKRYKLAKEFDPHKHSFNPLQRMTYRKARDLTSVFYGSEGKDTLTVRNGKRALARMLLKADYIDRLPKELGYDKKDDKPMYDAVNEAHALAEDILLSPILRDIFCRRGNFSIKDGNPPSSIVARIDRAKLGDYDAFILASLLISQFKGQIIIPDFGFYARPFHASLIRENRLIAGVFTLAELDEKMRQMCLLMEKEARQCTYDDAETLAKYRGLVPTTNEYKEYVASLMSGEL